MSFKLSFVATENQIVIYHNGKRHMVSKKEDPDKFDELRGFIIAKDQEAVIRLLSGAAGVVEHATEGLFKVDREKREVIDTQTGTVIGRTLADRIIQFYEEGLPYEPLIKFHHKVLKLSQYSKASADELFEFLEKNKVTITDEGNFIAYKKVSRINNKLVDTYTRRVSNEVGSIVRKNRDDCDHNRRNECSRGLHVAGWSYMKSYPGDTILEVEVNPEHVVSVPMDYDFAKMRVHEYTVLREVDEQRNEIYATVKKRLKNGDLVQQNETTAIVGVVEAEVSGFDFNSMTARRIKEFILEMYGVTITIDDKNKKQIIRKANQIVFSGKKL